DRLCCLIHDSQLDKRDFVLDLKRTYEEFLAEGERPAQGPTEGQRQLVETIGRELAALSRYYDGMSAAPAAAGTPVRSLLQQAVRLSGALPGSPLKKGTVPLGRADMSREDRSSERDSPLFQQAARLDAARAERVPRYAVWHEHAEAIEHFRA